MIKIVSLSSAVAAALIVTAGPVFYLHAQTPDKALVNVSWHQPT
jgi:hypothetical protein